MLNMEKIKMKHEIEIPDLPEGWEPVAYRIPKAGEYYFESQGVKLAQINFENLWLVVRKKQPRRIVLEEAEEGTDNSHHNHTIYVKGITIDIYSNKLWKIVEDNKCAE